MRHIIKSNYNLLGNQKNRKICISEEVKASPNASAMSHESGIKVTSGSILISKTDSQLAAVIAHELAHIYRNHGRACIQMLKRQRKVLSFSLN